MNWMKNFSDALNYIEENISNDIKIENIANAACSSKYHFTKLFLVLSGMTLGEYIRKRKLTLAVKDLMEGNKVIDVALKYGYQTPESFSKSFKLLHNCSPSDIKNSEVLLNAFPPLSFQITVKGEEKMDYKIVEKDSFIIKGVTKNVGVKNDENFVEIPKFWEMIYESGQYEIFKNASDDGTVISASIMGEDYDFSDENSRFDYMIGIFGNKNVTVPNCLTYEVPESKWAIFTLPGTKIQETWKRIFHEWFPATNYEHAIIPELEVYPPGNIMDPNYKLEIWIPIIIK